MKEIKKALISVYDKDGILEIANTLVGCGVEIISTGGTADYLAENNINVTKVEELTSYPSILGGRVKTLHPKIFGGILSRRDNSQDNEDLNKYSISNIDLVIIDLYPFEEFVAHNATHSQIIEKIDIGGISLIRAAAKNYEDVVIIPSKEFYPILLQILNDQGATTQLSQREQLAAHAFGVSSQYDSLIFSYFNKKLKLPRFSKIINDSKALRYGENPHQKGRYFGGKDTLPIQLHGKEISYNNLLDVEAAIELISDFENPTVAIIKHTNACGVATDNNICDAWKKALAADPVSAFGGIIVSNREIDADSANEINNIFFEIIIAPSYSQEALQILKCKKNRIILINNGIQIPPTKFRSLLNGVLVQDRDCYIESDNDLQIATTKSVTEKEIEDLMFANKIVKHSKSNAIVIVKDNQLLASGVGQTSRVDALKQAIAKAKSFGFSLKGAALASDAFFPFKDCVEIAHQEGIMTVIQPGGSIRDQESIDFCNENGMAMVITGIRHFKH